MCSVPYSLKLSLFPVVLWTLSVYLPTFVATIKLSLTVAIEIFL